MSATASGTSFQSNAFQTLVTGPAVLASPKSMLKMQILWPTHTYWIRTFGDRAQQSDSKHARQVNLWVADSIGNEGPLKPLSWATGEKRYFKVHLIEICRTHLKRDHLQIHKIHSLYHGKYLFEIALFRRYNIKLENRILSPNIPSYREHFY